MTVTVKSGLRSNVAWLTGGNIGYTVSQGAILVVLARMGSAEVVGQFALAMAITAPISALFQLRLRDVLATDASDSYSFLEYVRLTALLSVPALVVSYLAGELFYGPEVRFVIFFAALSKVAETHSYIVYGLLQKQERMRRVGVSTLIRGWGGFIGLAVAFSVTDSLTWALVALTAVWIAVFVMYDLPYVWDHLWVAVGAVGWRFRRLTSLTWLALPLGFTSLLVALNASIPRLYLERYQGEVELGIFGAMAYVVAALSVVIRGVSGAVAPRLSSLFVSGDAAAFRRLFLRLVAGTIGFWAVSMLGAVGLGRIALDVLYGAEYSQHVGVFQLILLASLTIFVALPLTYAMIAQRRLREQVYVLMASAAVALAIGPTFIARWGMAGAAWSLFAAGAARILVSAEIVRRSLRALERTDG